MWDTKPKRFIPYTHNPSPARSHSLQPAPVTYTRFSGNGSINYSQQVARSTSSVTSSPWTDSAAQTPPSELGESCWDCVVSFWRNRHLWLFFFVCFLISWHSSRFWVTCEKCDQSLHWNKRCGLCCCFFYLHCAFIYLYCLQNSLHVEMVYLLHILKQICIGIPFILIFFWGTVFPHQLACNPIIPFFELPARCRWSPLQ